MTSASTVASYTGSRPDVLALVPRDARRVLDVGCSDGSLGVAIKQRQAATVTGVELDAGFAARARERLNEVIGEDAGAAAARLRRLHARFDCIVCADVLEHLPCPEAVLEDLVAVLDDRGSVVVSLPNVRHLETFLQLGIRGRWPRRDRGIHDRTHLSWFTDDDARALFAAAGLEILDTTVHYRLRDRYAHPLNRYAKWVAIGPLRGLLAYQMLYLLRRRRP